MVEKQTRGRQWYCNGVKLTFGAFYFFFLSSFTTKCVYLPIYLKQLGLTASYVGILSGMVPFIRGAGAPILGYVADRTNTRKVVFLLSLAAHALIPVLLLIPRPDEPICQTNVSFHGRSRNRTFPYRSNTAMSRNFRIQYSISSNRKHSLLNESTLVLTQLNPKDKNGDIEFEQSLDMLQIFVILLILFIFGEFIGGPTKNLADSALLENLDSESMNYGRFRMWGNIGQVLQYFIASPLAKSNTLIVCGEPIQDDYGLTMFLVTISLLGAFVMGLKINFKQDDVETTAHDATDVENKPLKDVLLTFRSITFIIIILYLGIVDGVFTTFMF